MSRRHRQCRAGLFRRVDAAMACRPDRRFGARRMP
jgi:hypothetical protein